MDLLFWVVVLVWLWCCLCGIWFFGVYGWFGSCFFVLCCFFGFFVCFVVFVFCGCCWCCWWVCGWGFGSVCWSGWGCGCWGCGWGGVGGVCGGCCGCGVCFWGWWVVLLCCSFWVWGLLCGFCWFFWFCVFFFVVCFCVLFWVWVFFCVWFVRMVVFGCIGVACSVIRVGLWVSLFGFEWATGGCWDGCVGRGQAAHVAVAKLAARAGDT
ncbi:hypothetical protein, partial [Pseudomonas syringae group genomosp. 7]|uniref:hypothetical protein n=1 Tax=Pseudomonas syringae group genomosp. 7 TaxID=251699 RepID=UPI00376FAC10